MMSVDPGALIVPALREDLRLHMNRGSDVGGGFCLVYDPVAHRYHELNENVFLILQNWCSGIRLDKFSMDLSRILSARISIEDLRTLMLQLDHAGFFSQPLRGWHFVYQKQQKRRRNWFTWILHNYLFIRIPLVKPDAFLEKTLSIAQFFASRSFLSALLVMAVLAAYMVSQQWNAFWNTFLHFFSLEGAAGYILAVGFVKLFHEMGHAYMAKNFGCRVPTMGIAFLVLAPVLYTDVTDAWKLETRRERLLISAAGMIVEFAMAIITTFMWAILPEGTMKSACFFVATTSLVISLIINLSPLMRFDGYYLLADYLRISNLQPRAFVLLCWWLREILFGLGVSCPEDWSPAKRAGIIFYAVIVCLYRFFLFLGIALLVYHITTKTLGILLFVVEILWFIIYPIVREIKEWWKLRKKIWAGQRIWVTSSLLGLLVVAMLIPFPYKITVPAVMEPVSMQRIVTALPVRVGQVMVKSGDPVEPGDLIVRLESDQLRAEIERVRIEMDLAHLRRNRRIGDSVDRDQTFILNKDILALHNELKGLQRLESDLAIHAKERGMIADMLPYLHEGRYLKKGQELGIIVAMKDWQVRGYLGEHLVPTVKEGASGEFIPDDPLGERIKVKLSSIRLNAASVMDLPYLSSTYGGQIAVNEDKRKGSIPVEAHYQIIFVPQNLQPVSVIKCVQRGIVRIQASPESFAIRTAKRALAVLIRESGF